MRHDLQRVPGKNYRELAGHPLYAYILGTLLSCPEISMVVVDTDSPVIKDGVRQQFPTVKVIDRPEHLRSGETPMNEVLLYDTSLLEADFYLQTHSTNPLLRQETISGAIQALLQNYPMYDSLFSVTRIQRRLWDSLGRAINHNPDVLLRTQDLPPIFEENSCIYIYLPDPAERQPAGERPLMFEINA
jgi:CMP-N-acetylneuraminic acid synthetase